MTLRRHRRNVVIWRSSHSPDHRGRGLWFTPAVRSSRVRRWARISGLLLAVGLLRVAAAVRPRWRPLAAGTVLTVAGFIMRSGMPGVVMIPGMLFLTAALLAPSDPAADNPRHRALERELAGRARWNRPEGGYFLWLELAEEVDAGDLLARATEAGVTFVPGADFGGPPSSVRLAFSFVSPEEIDEGVRRLARLVAVPAPAAV